MPGDSLFIGFTKKLIDLNVDYNAIYNSLHCAGNKYKKSASNDYCDKLVSNTVLEIILNRGKGSLKFINNGVDKGWAFRNEEKLKASEDLYLTITSYRPCCI